MAIGELQREVFRLAAFADKDFVVLLSHRHHGAPCVFVDTIVAFL
jgi:hypothetical protein